jgi:hypothetical protein
VDVGVIDDAGFGIDEDHLYRFGRLLLLCNRLRFEPAYESQKSFDTRLGGGARFKRIPPSEDDSRAADGFRASNRRARAGRRPLPCKQHIPVGKRCNDTRGHAAQAPELAWSWIHLLGNDALFNRIDSYCSQILPRLTPFAENPRSTFGQRQRNMFLRVRGDVEIGKGEATMWPIESFTARLRSDQSPRSAIQFGGLDRLPLRPLDHVQGR